MKIKKIIVLIMGICLLVSCIAGCKKKDGKDTDNLGNEATQTPSSVTSAVTDAPKPTSEDVTSAPTEAPSPTDTAADDTAGKKTAPGASEALDAYQKFIDGSITATVAEDTFHSSKGKYTVRDFVNDFSQGLSDDYLPSVFTSGQYSIIDCGDDGYPELMLYLIFETDTEYKENADEYAIFKYIDGEIRLLDEFQGYYRSSASINRYGYVSQGGNAGAMSYASMHDFINADGKTVRDYYDTYYMEIPGPVLSNEYLSLPESLKGIIGSYETGENDGYYLDVIRFNEYDSTGVAEDKWNEFYLGYFCDAIYTFSDRNGDSVMPEADYVKLCADNNVVILDKSATDQKIDEHRKEIGLTDTIINGGDPEWNDITSYLAEGFIVFPVSIDETHFPDPNFRSYILEKIDADKDSMLSREEMKSTDRVNVSNKDISDLKGIEYFMAVTEIDSDNNKLTGIDVSRNSKLQYLICGNSGLTSIDVSRNLNLEWLYVFDNHFTSIDVSSNPALQRLYIGDSDLSELDVSKNPSLKELSCYGNQLTSLDLSKNPELHMLSCGENKLTSLDLSNNPALSSLACYSNQLTSLDLSHNPELGGLMCEHNQLTSLDVSVNTELGELHCSDNKLTSLDISQNTRLYAFECSDNMITDLKLGSKPYLDEFFCKGNKLSSIDVSGCSSDIFIEMDDGVELIR